MKTYLAKVLVECNRYTSDENRCSEKITWHIVRADTEELAIAKVEKHYEDMSEPYYKSYRATVEEISEEIT